MELSQCKERLDAWFSDKEPEMLSMLERIVNMDSFTNDAADVNKVGEVVTGWLAEAGFHTAKLPKKPAPADEQWMNGLGNVFSARTHSVECGPGVAFIGHMDTVFPAGTAGARPFRLDRAADRATGPGVTDMKAGIVQNMFVARALKELGLMDVPMTLTFSPDEELGSPSTTPILGEQLNGAQAVICTEPGYPGGGVTLERKGSGHMFLEIMGISAHAGAVIRTALPPSSNWPTRSSLSMPMWILTTTPRSTQGSSTAERLRTRSLPMLPHASILRSRRLKPDGDWLKRSALKPQRTISRARVHTSAAAYAFLRLSPLPAS